MHAKFLKSRWIYLLPLLTTLIGAALLIIPVALTRTLSTLTAPLYWITPALPLTYLTIGLLLLIPALLTLTLQTHARTTSAAEFVNTELRIIKGGRLRATLHAEDLITVEITDSWFDRLTHSARITLRAKANNGKREKLIPYRLGRIANAESAQDVLDIFRGLKPRRRPTAQKTEQAPLNATGKTKSKTDTTSANPPRRKSVKKEESEKTAEKKRRTTKTTATDPREKPPSGAEFTYPDIKPPATPGKPAREKPLTPSESRAKAEYLRRTAGSEKGTAFENEVDALLKKRDTIPIHHKTLKNLYVPYGDGTRRLTEIDNIVVAETGIYVFECKNYAGTILGQKDAREWTMVYDNGEMKTFYSPILQNKGHIRTLSDLLGIPKDLFRSVIVFSGHTNLNGVEYNHGDTSIFCIDTLARDLRNKTTSAEPLLCAGEVDKIYSWLIPYTDASYQDKLYHLNRVEKLAQKEEA